MMSMGAAGRFKHSIALLCATALVLSLQVFAVAETKDTPVILRYTDYEKYGMPKIGNTFWTEAEHMTAVKVLGKLAESDPKLLPGFAPDGVGHRTLQRLTSPQRLSTDPTASKYFDALEALYLKHRSGGVKIFDAIYARIKTVRISYMINHLKSKPSANERFSAEVSSSLLGFVAARLDVKDEFGVDFQMRISNSDSLFSHTIKKMPPAFQEKIVLKIDEMVAANPDIARKRKVVPDFMEKMLKTLPDVRPKAMKFKMKHVKLPDLTKKWKLTDLKQAVQWLIRQKDINRAEMPRIDSPLLRKMLDPQTVKSAATGEGNVYQLMAAMSTARGLYLSAFRMYRDADLKGYMKEAIPLLETFYRLWWEDIEKFEIWEKKMRVLDKAFADKFLHKQFNQSAMTFCAWSINDAAYARLNFPLESALKFQAFAAEHYPQAFKMMTDEYRTKAAGWFLRYKKNTDKWTKGGGPKIPAGLLGQKAMVDRIAAGIKSYMPKTVK
ncbi:MAG: hypothetical protein QGH60_11285 [Phycisphaerae bacterium]|jgi:hypothetical protein|nr:hypothetical protein [Phycisphaerae bacterium]